MNAIGALHRAVADPEPEHTGLLVVTLNGPGEVAGWLDPLVAALKQRSADMTIVVALLPCVYASGTERSVLERMIGIDGVLDKAETLRLIFRGRAPRWLDTGAEGLLLHFGGEPFLSHLLARRLGLSTRAYLERPSRSQRWFDEVYYVEPSRGMNGGSVIGNLMVDAALDRYPRARVSGDDTVVGILPGSRLWQLENMLPFSLQVAGRIARTRPEIRWLVTQADFITDDMMRECATARNCVLPGVRSQWRRTGDSTQLVTETGLVADVVSPREMLARATVALTVPGTNTAELAVHAIPMLVLLPTHDLARMPTPGVFGYLDRVPAIGAPLKRSIGNLYLSTWRRRHGYLAHPNRRLGRMVVPEIIGQFGLEEVVTGLEHLLDGPLAEMSRDLEGAMGQPGAADRLATELLSALPVRGLSR